MAPAATPGPSSPLEQAHGSLVPALDLLRRFHHRNKNQHRSSSWWSACDMLRRHTRKLVLGMQADMHRNGRPKMSTPSEAVTARADFLRSQLVPRAYLAFTQLVADGQFAPAGLLLLGILAQVDAALAPFAPTRDTLPDSADHADVPTAADASIDSLADVGVPVLRDQLSDVGEPVDRMEADGDASASASASAMAGASKPSQNVSESIGHAVDAIPDTLHKSEPLSKKDEKKKKKMKKKGDEFDDLFAWSEKTKRPKKKAKRKRVDEFDDIFASLCVPHHSV